MKTNIIIGVVIVLALAIGGYVFMKSSSEEVVVDNDKDVLDSETQIPVESDNGIGDGAEALEPVAAETEVMIGTSVENRDITAYHYGTGEKEIVFIGGIHGGYSWNTALVAYELMDYLDENPATIPDGVKVTVIPTLNPDGLYDIVGTTARFQKENIELSIAETIPGRFNANNVDLNRNFDCDWKASGVWQSRTVSGGTSAFSEPESAAVKKYIEKADPVAVVAWYSSAGGVYSSSCGNGVSSETSALTKAFASASGYPAYEEFDSYEINGDMMNWLAKEGYPAISVLLTTHTDTEWSKNQKGIEAVLKYYAK